MPGHPASGPYLGNIGDVGQRWATCFGNRASSEFDSHHPHQLQADGVMPWRIPQAVLSAGCVSLLRRQRGRNRQRAKQRVPSVCNELTTRVDVAGLSSILKPLRRHLIRVYNRGRGLKVSHLPWEQGIK